MAERKVLSKKTRFEVFKRDKFTCQYCGRMAPDVILEVDHIKPVAKGGDNSMLNLITSCKDCNRGKRDKELSDDTSVKKQQAQLKALAERKEQLEMILQWRDGLKQLENESLDAVVKIFADKTGRTLTDEGKEKIRKWIREFSLIEVLDATEIAIDHYYDKTKSSLEFAFNKISGICHNKRIQKNDMTPFYTNYIIKALKNKGYYFDENIVRRFIKNNVDDEYSFDDVKVAVKISKNYSQFQDICERVFCIEF